MVREGCSTMAVPGTTNIRLVLSIFACLGLAAAAVLLVRSAGPAATPEGEWGNGDPRAASAHASTLGKDPAQHAAKTSDPQQPEKEAREILACYLTRRGARPYQSQVRYRGTRLPAVATPGWAEITEALELQGRPLPQQVLCVDQETETWADNLGEETRTLTSYRAYLLEEGLTLAYDLAMTTGGLPQRFSGHLTKNGVAVDIYQGSRKVDRKDVDLPRNVQILPPVVEAFHHFFKQQKAPHKPAAFTFFAPELLDTVTALVTPMGQEMLAHQGANQECARYEIVASSPKASEGVTARQQMWFSLKDGLLLKRVAFASHSIAFL